MTQISSNKHSKQILIKKVIHSLEILFAYHPMLAAFPHIPDVCCLMHAS